MSGLQGVYSLITIYFLLLAFPSTSSFFTGQYLRHHPIYHLPTAFEFFTTRSSKHKHDTKLLVSDSGDVNVGDNHDEMSLKNPSGIPTLPLLFADSKCVPSQMSPTSLAYIGDVVYEMCIRCRYVWPTRRTTDLQNVVVAKVRAETQSNLFKEVVESFPLTKQEQTIVSRGRNAGSPKKKSRVPKRLNNKSKDASSSNSSSAGQGPSVYQDSTALEALIGYLYLSDFQRCNDLLEFISRILDRMDKEEGVVY